MPLKIGMEQLFTKEQGLKSETMIEKGFAIKQTSDGLGLITGDLFLIFWDEGDADFFLKRPPVGKFEKTGPVMLSESDIWMLQNVDCRPRYFEKENVSILNSK